MQNGQIHTSCFSRVIHQFWEPSVKKHQHGRLCLQQVHQRFYGRFWEIRTPELETVQVSRNPTRAITDNGEVQTKEEATVCVNDLDLFVAVQILEDTPAVLSFGKLCADHGCTAVKNFTFVKQGLENCAIRNFVPIVPGLSTKSPTFSSSTSRTSLPLDSVADDSTPIPVLTRSQSTPNRARKGLLLHAPKQYETNV